jgi:hypothetical protein
MKKLEGTLSVAEGGKVAGGDLLHSTLSREGLLVKEARSRQHSKAAVLELLQLHSLKLSGVLRFDSKGVPGEITGGGVLLNGCSQHLNGSNADQDLPHSARALRIHLHKGINRLGIGEDGVGELEVACAG